MDIGTQHLCQPDSTSAVTEYPDSGKVNILPERKIFESSSSVDYYKVEENVAAKWPKQLLRKQQTANRLKGGFHLLHSTLPAIGGKGESNATKKSMHMVSNSRGGMRVGEGLNYLIALIHDA